jgi:hypothetical protein
MGKLSFLIPSGLPIEATSELERASMAGGQDNMPYATTVVVDPGQLEVSRKVDESGYLMAPWLVEGAGLVMTGTATIIERPQPYHLALELARGKVNQVRGQAADWLQGGLQVPVALNRLIRDATFSFGKAISHLPAAEATQFAQTALAQGYRAADQLVQAYVNQVFQVRRQRQPRLDSLLGIRLGAAPPDDLAEPFLEACNVVAIPFPWSAVEPAEADYRWGPFDALLQWAETNRRAVIGGPLIDFSATRLPDWLWLWEGDLSSLASFMCDFVEVAVKRYQGRITTWQLSAASNWSEVLGLGEDELLWLTVRLAEAARQVDPDIDVIVGVAQPWGEYLTPRERTHTPFAFADTLIRSGLNLAALDLEVVMGVTPRGSYARDLLELSRLLDLYALLGVPLQVTLGYPSSSSSDLAADSEMVAAAGYWRDGFTPDEQADWATAFGSLALCKPYVRGVQWAHLTDAEPHQFPCCGLVDAAGAAKPALQRLRELRKKHLR